jgi:hypothetical protein
VQRLAETAKFFYGGEDLISFQLPDGITEHEAQASYIVPQRLVSF